MRSCFLYWFLSTWITVLLFQIVLATRLGEGISDSYSNETEPNQGEGEGKEAFFECVSLSWGCWIWMSGAQFLGGAVLPMVRYCYKCYSSHSEYSVDDDYPFHANVLKKLKLSGARYNSGSSPVFLAVKKFIDECLEKCCLQVKKSGGEKIFEIDMRSLVYAGKFILKKQMIFAVPEGVILRVSSDDMESLRENLVTLINEAFSECGIVDTRVRRCSKDEKYIPQVFLDGHSNSMGRCARLLYRLLVENQEFAKKFKVKSGCTLCLAYKKTSGEVVRPLVEYVSSAPSTHQAEFKTAASPGVGSRPIAGPPRGGPKKLQAVVAPVGRSSQVVPCST